MNQLLSPTILPHRRQQRALQQACSTSKAPVSCWPSQLRSCRCDWLSASDSGLVGSVALTSSPLLTAVSEPDPPPLSTVSPGWPVSSSESEAATTSSSTVTDLSEKSSGLSQNDVIQIVVGTVVPIFCLIATAVFTIWWHKRRRTRRGAQVGDGTD
ncbi:hypothetical protein EJ04DRAFT_67905 [Polyplosphaeria fusca]|uniref:Uncharacterized protein n=1 Tax=Polyplosphaeria fusca TaxID=682080 RepID=A0A9P4R7D2_9PLEO|nr:hypothetical protein EJ04DRAFT_67905 [Polyplosphaeria fusca]